MHVQGPCWTLSASIPQSKSAPTQILASLEPGSMGSRYSCQGAALRPWMQLCRPLGINLKSLISRGIVAQSCSKQHALDVQPA